MKRLPALLFVVAALFLSVCRKPPVKPESLHLRLDVTTAGVTCGSTQLPSNPTRLSDYILNLAPGDDTHRDVRFVFSRDLPAERIGDMMNSAALFFRGDSRDFRFFFNIAAYSGQDFNVFLMDQLPCCASRRFRFPEEDPSETSSPSDSRNFWVRTGLEIHAGTITVERQPLDSDELSTLLWDRRQSAAGVLVEITVQNGTTVADLLPAFEACQLPGVEMNLHFESQDGEDRLQRSMRQSIMRPPSLPFRAPPPPAPPVL